MYANLIAAEPSTSSSQNDTLRNLRQSVAAQSKGEHSEGSQPMELDDDAFFDASQNTPSFDADEVQPLQVRNSDSRSNAAQNGVADTVADNLSAPTESDDESQTIPSQDEEGDASQESESETMQGKFRTKSISKLMMHVPIQTKLLLHCALNSVVIPLLGTACLCYILCVCHFGHNFPLLQKPGNVC